MADESHLIWSESEVRVYLYNLDRCYLEQVLNDEELEQAAKKRSGDERLRFVKRRSVLRHVLADALDVGPDQIALEYGSVGKPYVPRSSIRFNASHSGSLFVVAVSDRYEVGVDIQMLTDTQTLLLGLDSFLTPSEAIALARAGKHRHRLLHQLWTRKESAAKALGTGLSANLAQLNSLTDHTCWCGKDIRLRNLPEHEAWFGSVAWMDP